MLVDINALRDRLVQEPILQVAAAVHKWDIPSTLRLPDGFVIPEVPGLKKLSPEEQLEILVEIRTGRDLDHEDECDRLCDECFAPIYGDYPCEHEEKIPSVFPLPPPQWIPSGPILDWIPIYKGLHEWEQAHVFVCANPESPKWGFIGIDNNDSHGRRGFDVVPDTLDALLLQYKVLYDRYLSQEELRNNLDNQPDSEHERILREFGVEEATESPLTTLRSDKGFNTYFG